METILLAVAVGVGVGMVVAALGAGGGILAVPVLVFLLGQDAHVATASSLVIVLITALFSLPHHVRRGNVQWRQGLVFAAVSVLGAVLGGRLSVLVPPQALLTLFGAMLLVVGAAMLRRGLGSRRLEAEGTGTPAAGPRFVPLVGAATLTGFLTGFFGVGGGFIVVPMLVLALGLAMRSASGTSLLVMVVATLAGLLARIGTDVRIDWTVTLAFAAGSALGGVMGGPVSARARPSTLTLLFALLLGAVAIATLLGTWLG